MSRKPKSSLMRHPDAILFSRISREGVFQQPRLLTTDSLVGILVVPFVAAGIAPAAFRMHSNGIEQVRSNIAQRLVDFAAGDICGVAPYAARLLVCFTLLVRTIRESLCCARLWRLSFARITRYVFEGTG